MTTVFKNLDILQKWAEYHGAKTAFVAAPGMGAPPMDPAMDPAMMGMPPGAPPMDPAMMGMPPAPPMDPAMMGMPPEAPPMDPSMQAMSDQEGMRSIIREEIQKAMGSGDGGPGIATPSAGRKSDKFENAVAQMKEQSDQNTKILVAALRKAGIDIPLADVMALDGSTSQQGVVEGLQPGQPGTLEGGLIAKAASLEADIEHLVALAKVRDSLKTGALNAKLVPFDPLLPEKNYFTGVFR